MKDPREIVKQIKGLQHQLIGIGKAREEAERALTDSLARRLDGGKLLEGDAETRRLRERLSDLQDAEKALTRKLADERGALAPTILAGWQERARDLESERAKILEAQQEAGLLAAEAIGTLAHYLAACSRERVTFDFICEKLLAKAFSGLGWPWAVETLRRGKKIDMVPEAVYRFQLRALTAVDVGAARAAKTIPNFVVELKKIEDRLRAVHHHPRGHDAPDPQELRRRSEEEADRLLEKV